MTMQKPSPFAKKAIIVAMGALGFGLQFDGIPAAIYRTELKANGSRYNKPLNVWPLGQNQALGESIIRRMAEYAAQAAVKANVTKPAVKGSRGAKSSAHKNLEQLLGVKMTKAQFEEKRASLLAVFNG